MPASIYDTPLPALPTTAAGLSAHGELCQRLIRSTCEKMVRAKSTRTAMRLDKHVALLRMLSSARESHVQSLRTLMHFPINKFTVVPAEEIEVHFGEEVEDDDDAPPFEMVVEASEEETDDDVETADPKMLIWGEAVEEDGSEDEDVPPALSSDVDEALRKLAGSPPCTDRKRGPAPVPGRAKKQFRHAILRPLSCK